MITITKTYTIKTVTKFHDHDTAFDGMTEEKIIEFEELNSSVDDLFAELADVEILSLKIKVELDEQR